MKLFWVLLMLFLVIKASSVSSEEGGDQELGNSQTEGMVICDSGRLFGCIRVDVSVGFAFLMTVGSACWLIAVLSMAEYRNNFVPPCVIFFVSLSLLLWEILNQRRHT